MQFIIAAERCSGTHERAGEEQPSVLKTRLRLGRLTAPKRVLRSWGERVGRVVRTGREERRMYDRLRSDCG